MIDIQRVRDQSVEEHQRWRLRVRADFLRELGRGLIARGFERDPANATSRYLFGQDESQFSFGGDK